MRYLFICSLIFISFASCIEPVALVISRTGGQVIIDGRFTNEPGPEVIFIGIAANKSRVPEVLSGATITIFDDEGNTANFIEDPRQAGKYLLPDEAMDAVIGKTYFIEVSVPDRGVYRSRPEKLLAPQAKLEAIYYDFTIEEEVNENAIVFENTFINAYIDVSINQTNEEPFFLRWDVEEVFLVSPTDFPDPFGHIPPPCYVYKYTSDININLFDGSRNQGEFLQEVKVGTQKIDFSFREKHYFTVYQRSISQEAYEYWRKAGQLLTNVGSIFDTPPAPIPGNMHNVEDAEEEVLGYFEVASSSHIRFRTFRDDIPVDQILECLYLPSKATSDYPDYCLNCQTLRNSTFVRPDFF